MSSSLPPPASYLEQKTFDIIVDSQNMPLGNYNATMIIETNIDDVSIPINLEVSDTAGIIGDLNGDLFLNIQDVILQTSTLGNFLDYGTVVPLTASGIGTGQSTSTAALQSALGTRLRIGLSGAQSKGKTITNESPEYALVCIPKARQAYKMILEGSDSQKNCSN